MSLLIINQASVPVPRSYLSKAFVFFVKELKSRRLLSSVDANKELTLVFMPPPEAKKLNQQFRNKSYATDVLSFESEDPSSYGELVLCSQVLKKQAKEHKLSFRDEVVYMVLHGLLHLLGYEHEGCEKQAQIMFQLQDALYEKFLAQKL